MNASSSHCFRSSTLRTFAPALCLAVLMLTITGFAAAMLEPSLHGAGSPSMLIVTLITGMTTLAAVSLGRGSNLHSLGLVMAAAPRASTPASSEAMTTGNPILRDRSVPSFGRVEARSSVFSPSGTVTRTNLAVALVNALGLEADAQAKAGTDVTATFDGTTIVVSDQSSIPAALRGYVQIALDKGILNASFSFQQDPGDPEPHIVAKINPTAAVTWSFFAFAIDHYRQASAASN